MSTSVLNSSENIPLASAVALSRAAFGCGLGLLLAERLKQPARQATAIALVSVGALSLVPCIVQIVAQQMNRPESERRMRQQLRSIRDDSSFVEEDIY